MRRPLPRLILIGDGFSDGRIAERIVAAVAAGVPWVHLRDHKAGEAEFRSAAKHLADRLRSLSADVMISVNSRLDVASELASGLHVGKRCPAIAEARQPVRYPLGYSTHDLPSARDAKERGADYLTYSPVYPTSSKPRAAPLGLDQLARCCVEVSPLPVFALGGITPERVQHCLKCGAYGAAVLSGILYAKSPADAAAAYCGAIQKYSSHSPPS